MSTRITERPRLEPVERTIAELTDVENKEALTREQLYAARLATWSISTRQQEAEHKQRIAEDRQQDAIRGLPLPGHRKGRRARLTWPTTLNWERWRDKFEGIPSIDGRYTIRISSTAYEFPGDEVTPPTGRRYTEIPVDEPEVDWLRMHGVTVTQAGSFTEPLETNETP